MNLQTLDLQFFTPTVIASYLIETAAGPILIETGPDTVFENLESQINAAGYSVDDVGHVFVTHIHLDHAGSAWRFAERGATIYVHPAGAKHLEDPSKLLASAARIYGDDMDRLWGRVEPIPHERIRITGDKESIAIGSARIQVLETPGHASHHNAYLFQDAVFTGDVGGIRIDNGPVFPPTPPPDINIELWQESIRTIRNLNPAILFPTHFGASSSVDEHLDELESRLLEWTAFVGERVDAGKDDATITAEFKEMVESVYSMHSFSELEKKASELADPHWMNVLGLVRYWKKYRM
jgi:glyoxylase-like metal-dependent hydrolase (beta-lactamase superfamily II)